MWTGGTSPAWAASSLIDVVLWSTLAIVAVVFYLAGAAFAMRIRNVLRARRYNSYEASWEPVLLDVIDGSVALSGLQATVTSRSRRHFLKFLVRYARLLSGGDRQIVVDLAEQHLPMMVGDLKARNPERRAFAVQTLATLGMEKYGPAIAGALDDASALVSMVAARTLSASRQPAYIDDVLFNLHRYARWNSRFLSSMLASMGSEVAPALRSFLRSNRDPLDRAVAADALSLLTDPAAADVAAGILNGTPDRELAAASLRLLRTVGGPEHLPIVRSCATSRDFVLRALALRVLGTVGEAADLDLLEQGMAHPEPWVAINSAQAMLEAGGAGRLEAMVASGHPLAPLAREAIMERVG